MNDDKIVKDTARDPEREALGPLRGGVRAAAKGAVRKVAKSTGQKKTARRTTATAGKTTKRAVQSATKTDKPAPAKVATPASRKSSTTRARAAAAKTGAAAAETATAASGAAFASESAAAGATDASRSVAGTPATPAAAPPEPGPSIETSRPPAPMHPGASMDSAQEQAGGLGGVLALWGPLIIIGFLVLVFQGGGEGGSTVATGPDAPGQAAADVPAETVRGPLAGGTGELVAGARTPERMPGPPGTARGVAEAFDGGFTMRTSMASPPPLTGRAFAGRGSDAGTPAGASGMLYPSPPGPYRDPRYRGLPTGESWSTEGPEARRHEDGADAPVQWVPCAPPYYWCPAPSSPAW